MRLPMNRGHRWVALVIASAIVVFALRSTIAAAQTVKGAIRGEVTDSSGGVLKGVTVVVTAPDGQVLARAVSDAKGG